MTDDSTQTYLDQSPASRERQYAELFATYDAAHSGSDDEYDADQAIDESVLGIEQIRGFEVTISTGGPGEWLECTVDTRGGSLMSVDFVCAWWSTPQRTRVVEGSALWRLADRLNPAQFE